MTHVHRTQQLAPGGPFSSDVSEREERDRERKWDLRFLDMAEHVAQWSKDPSNKVGAVIVRPDLTVASVGFNGFPKGCSDDPSIYEDRDLKLARVIHAELNAILHAREPLHGYTIYTSPPCDRCAAHIIQAGLSRVVYRRHEVDRFERWRDSIDRGNGMFAEAGVEVSRR